MVHSNWKFEYTLEDHFAEYERRHIRGRVLHAGCAVGKMISGEGVAIHGAFWHNDVGEQRSHGCINVKPEDTKWLFCWTTPHISLAQSEQRLTWPDHGTIASVTKLEL